MTVSVVKPWRTALQRDLSFPGLVAGPVLLVALCLLASICLSEVTAGLLRSQPILLFYFYAGGAIAVA